VSLIIVVTIAIIGIIQATLTLTLAFYTYI